VAAKSRRGNLYGLSSRQAVNRDRERGEQAVLEIGEQSSQSIGKMLCL
jgi:hypothetical protein